MTNPDEIRQLSIQQKNAIDLLVQGKSITEAAQNIGVTRQTLSGWCNHNASFQARLNQRRHEIWDKSGEKLRNLLPQAVNVLQEELQGDNRLRAAKIILKASGLYGNIGEPRGFKNAQTIIEEKQRQEKLRELEL